MRQSDRPVALLPVPPFVPLYWFPTDLNKKSASHFLFEPLCIEVFREMYLDPKRLGFVRRSPRIGAAFPSSSRQVVDLKYRGVGDFGPPPSPSRTSCGPFSLSTLVTSLFGVFQRFRKGFFLILNKKERIFLWPSSDIPCLSSRSSLAQKFISVRLPGFSGRAVCGLVSLDRPPGSTPPIYPPLPWPLASFFRSVGHSNTYDKWAGVLKLFLAIASCGFFPSLTFGNFLPFPTSL